MAGVRSASQANTQTWTFDGFGGLDTSRDAVALDTGGNQHFTRFVNGTCDWRGQVVRDPSTTLRANAAKVTHVGFYAHDHVAFTEQDGAGLHLVSDVGHRQDNAYDIGAVVSSAVFSRKLHFTSRGYLMQVYDGARFQPNRSPALALMRPSFLATIQRRLAVAGMPGAPTEVHISRVDNSSIFPGDEDPEEGSVLRAGVIDVANFIGTADEITGLAVYESNRLVIFTADRALVYVIDPDIDLWQIDDTVNIRTGCIGHNTIAAAGTDILFCSRSGIHSVQRSKENGIVVDSISLSDKVDLLYKRLYRSVENPSSISAVYDTDRAQYHVFFPQRDGVTCQRLSLALNPEGGEDGIGPAFSTGTFLNAQCGAFLAGSFVLGTSGGVWDVEPDEAADNPEAVSPVMEVVTPPLWHGSLSEEKQTHSFIMQASGRGIIEVTADDIQGRRLGSLRFEIDGSSDDTSFEGVPLSRQYERQWQHRYLAARYTFRLVESDGLVRIMGFALKTRTI